MLLTGAFLVTFALGILLGPLTADAQQTGKVARIGLMLSSSASATTRYVDAFRQGLRERGYVEGQNISIEYRWAEGRLERLPDLAADLVRLKVDIILAGATPGTLAAKNATGTIPIVMVGVVDPVGAGLIASLARPGGNITGLSMLSAELAGKRLQLLKEVDPRISRVAVLWNPTNRSNALQLDASKVAAPVLRVRLQSLEVRAPQDLESAFQAATRERAGALITLDDPLLLAQRARVVALASKNRLPAMYGLTGFVEAGGLMSYGVNLADHLRQAATYVDKILKGAKPADLPVEQPTRFELVINMKTAKDLGLTIPPSVLVRADQVIE